MIDFKGLKPLIVSYKELEAILYPITMGYAWGENTIYDLWKIGAPSPQSTIDNERRIVFPSQLAAWLTDVLNKQGKPLDEAAKHYMKLLQVSS